MFHRRGAIRLSFDCGDQMITKQDMKDECDIHNILRQYQRTGVITHVQRAQAVYGDLPSEIDYQTAQNTLIQAQAAFAALPAKVRDHFSNDPREFLAAFNDPAQADYLRSTGFLKAVQAVEASTATPVADSPNTGA